MDRLLLASRKNTAVLVGQERLLSICGDYLLEHGWVVDAVVTQAEGIVAWAEQRQIQCCQSFSQLRKQAVSAPDYLFSITNFQIVPPSILQWVKEESFNFHDGPLPEAGGLNVPNWSILEGRREHGVTWHKITSDIDGGSICAERRFEISESESVLMLNASCFEHAMDSFKDLVRSVADQRLTEKAGQSVKRYYARDQRPQQLGFVNWMQSADSNIALVRSTQSGGYRNGFATAKLFLGSCYAIIEEAEVVKEAETTAIENQPGTVLDTASNALTIACNPGILRLTKYNIASSDASNAHGIEVGQKLPQLDWSSIAETAGINLVNQYPLLNENTWTDRLQRYVDCGFPDIHQTPAVTANEPSLSESNTTASLAEIVASIAMVLARLNQTSNPGLFVVTEYSRNLCQNSGGYFSERVPVILKTTGNSEELITAAKTELDRLLKNDPMPSDLCIRYPEIRRQAQSLDHPSAVLHIGKPADLERQPSSATQLIWDIDSQSLTVVSPQGQSSSGYYSELILRVCEDLKAQNQPVNCIKLASPEDVAKFQALDSSAVMEVPDTTTTALVSQAASLHGDRIALSFRGQSISFREMEERSNAVSSFLIEHGFERGKVIGVLANKTVETVVLMLGIMKSGSAYLPLDPSYPADRIKFMLEDSAAACVFAYPNEATRFQVAEAVEPSRALNYKSLEAQDCNLANNADLAYLIYTSGSTGRPKGVMVTHDNVVNFIHGMHETLGKDPGVMLSVTSISFDISVLELWACLSLGYKVVIFESGFSNTGPLHTTKPEIPMNFSFFYWNSAINDQNIPHNRYNLLLESARFAEDNDFEAVWTPERHFADFGANYPNPSVISAAIAASTSRIKIRAGSCVAPLHHPVRIAEEWSVVDNLSNGRVGVSFASGWMPTDFVLAPHNFPNAKQVMHQSIDQVQKLWQGEAVEFEGPNGPSDITLYPKPVQKALPIWLTTAGTEASFIEAGRKGLNLLTHLLGQDLSILAEKIALYRTAWQEAGHTSSGIVTVMLHTFVTDSRENAKKIAREPMKQYLKTSMLLVKDAAWDFPTFKSFSQDGKNSMDDFFEQMSAEDQDDLLDFVFERYFETSGLFGSVEDCVKRVDEVKAIDADEIGCLIDFGIADEVVLANLPYLNDVKEYSNRSKDKSFAELTKQHQVTHLQCTPSQAKMFLLDTDAKQALASIKRMLVGGEAISQEISDELTALVEGRVFNMYGPTETTVWSATKRLLQGQPVSIGKAIANTKLRILDHERQNLPIGFSGELYIGGRGVTSGYLRRETLTKERFVELEGERFYATGDFARFNDDTDIEFLGRDDGQVKIRGYRIELGEIEEQLSRLNEITQVAVDAHADQWGENQLIAYYTGSRFIDLRSIRQQIGNTLPDFMIPTRFLRLQQMPYTPNAKLDRKALSKAKQLSKPPQTSIKGKSNTVTGTDTRARLAKIWSELLELKDIDGSANFFDLGGHSLLAVRMQGMLRQEFGGRFPISEIFRFPTVDSLARQLENRESATESVAVAEGNSRASKRKKQRGRLRK